jgi:hypothetical protein
LPALNIIIANHASVMGCDTAKFNKSCNEFLQKPFAFAAGNFHAAIQAHSGKICNSMQSRSAMRAMLTPKDLRLANPASGMHSFISNVFQSPSPGRHHNASVTFHGNTVINCPNNARR